MKSEFGANAFARVNGVPIPTSLLRDMYADGAIKVCADYPGRYWIDDDDAKQAFPSDVTGQD